MKKTLLTVLTLAFIFQSSIVYGEIPVNKQQAPSPVDQKELEFNRQAQEFYRNHIEYYKQLQEKRKNLQQQTLDLNKELAAATNDKKKKALQDQLSGIQRQLLDLSGDAAQHEIESSEFGIKMAQHRLEMAKKNLARISEQKKLLKK